MTIGVSGKYCAGKNSAARILEAKGFYHIDVDSLGHRALEQEKGGVISAFGEAVLREDGRIDRKKVGSIVFSNPEELKKLESIVHPSMVKMVEDILSEQREKGEENAVINAAVLFRMGLHRFCDRVFWIKAPLLLRLKRALKRDNTTIWKVLQRIWSQRDLQIQKNNKMTDIYIIDNSKSLRTLESEIEKHIER